MRTARPSEARSSHASLAWNESAAFGDTCDSLIGGGLNVDLLVGYEFLRASSVHFFGQIELNAPAYILKTENDSGAIDTYMPGAVAQIGVIF